MKKQLLFCLLLLVSISGFGQSKEELVFNRTYQDLPLDKTTELTYRISLDKGGIYQFLILQKGIGIYYTLSDHAGKMVMKSKIPNDVDGYLNREYTAISSGTFTLQIKRFVDPQNTNAGKITILVKSLSRSEINTRLNTRKTLEAENAKNVQTIDIDHFWEAFDQLTTCKTFEDSTAVIQRLYLDRATDGLIDFIEARDFTAEKFTKTISRYPKFYASIRKNSYEVKKSEPLIEEVFSKLKSLYAAFKPFKVCFAIGLLNTGGTVSNNFVLIGTEMNVSKDADVSEFINYQETSKAQRLSGVDDIVQNIKRIVAHECVHTQQKPMMDPNGISCELLYKVLKEGACDFIAELVTGNQLNKTGKSYGDKHEKELWLELKNELCNVKIDNWLYNGWSVKNKPADLGYYIGSQIAQEYYKNAADKNQAVIDIIEMTNPINFLEKSRYDQKEKQ